MAQSKYTVPLSIVNQTSVLHSSDVNQYAKAQQLQLTRDFLPYWGVSFQLYVRPSIQSIPKGSWVLWLLDDSDVQNALGYHDLTPEGKPIAKAFVKTDMQHNLKWTVTASHEILETAVDPFVDSVVLTSGPGGQGARLWAKETADAVEADDDGYDVSGIRLSNFVLPSWFGSGPAPYDFRGLLTAPFQIRPGGYMSVLDLRPQSGAQWTEIFGDQVGRARMRHPGLDRSDRRAKRYAKLEQIGAGN